jgi:hypothetical protein
MTKVAGFEISFRVRRAARAPAERLAIDVVRMASDAQLIPQGTVGLVEHWMPARPGSPSTDDICFVAWARHGGGGSAEPVLRKHLEPRGRATLHPFGGHE